MNLICTKCGWQGEDWQVVHIPLLPPTYSDFEKYCVCPVCKNHKSVREGLGTLRKDHDSDLAAYALYARRRDLLRGDAHQENKMTECPEHDWLTMKIGEKEYRWCQTCDMMQKHIEEWQTISREQWASEILGFKEDMQ